MILEKLEKKGLICPPKWLSNNTHYLVFTGSVAYGVTAETSDLDVYGFCMPPLQYIYPHTAGYIPGFGSNHPHFDQYQQHHIKDTDTLKEYDFSIYSIIKFFQLCMENNPNMVDCLFVPQRCILHSSHVGELVRSNRKKFLHKGSWHKFKGYAYSQLHKMQSMERVGKRKEVVDKFGYDVKFAYHVVRLMLEVEQILSECDLDLERHREQLKAIRRGEWKLEDVTDYFTIKEKSLEKLYNDSALPYGPNEDEIKELLIQCIKYCYPDITMVRSETFAEKQIAKIRTILNEV